MQRVVDTLLIVYKNECQTKLVPSKSFDSLLEACTNAAMDLSLSYFGNVMG